jgi:hypothetical protein
MAASDSDAVREQIEDDLRAIERSRTERERQRRLVEEAHKRVERIREQLRRASR